MPLFVLSFMRLQHYPNATAQKPLENSSDPERKGVPCPPPAINEVNHLQRISDRGCYRCDAIIRVAATSLSSGTYCKPLRGRDWVHSADFDHQPAMAFLTREASWSDEGARASIFRASMIEFALLVVLVLVFFSITLLRRYAPAPTDFRDSMGYSTRRRATRFRAPLGSSRTRDRRTVESPKQFHFSRSG